MRKLFLILICCFPFALQAQEQIIHLNKFIEKGTTLTKQEVDNNWIVIEDNVNSLNNAWITVTGDAVKTITVKRGDNSSWMSATFPDRDSQVLSSHGDSLSISGANTIKILPSELVFETTGTTATSYSLPYAPLSSKHLIVTMNTAFVDNADFTLIGEDIHFTFPIETTDKIKIYYKTQ